MTCLKGSNEGKCRRICIDRSKWSAGEGNEIRLHKGLLPDAPRARSGPKLAPHRRERKGVKSLFRGRKLGRSFRVCVRPCAHNTGCYMQLGLALSPPRLFPSPLTPSLASVGVTTVVARWQPCNATAYKFKINLDIALRSIRLRARSSNVTLLNIIFTFVIEYICTSYIHTYIQISYAYILYIYIFVFIMRDKFFRERMIYLELLGMNEIWI